MKTLLPFLLALPLAAQSFEVGLNVSRQTYTRSSAPGTPGHPDPYVFDYDAKTVVAARVGYALVDLGPALVQVTAAYQPKTDTDLKPNGATLPTTLSSEYWAVGAMVNFKALVSVGAGLDYRFEKATLTNVYTANYTFQRPWARVNAGYAFPTPVVKPFVTLEVAAPLTKDDHSPELQVGVYAGLRF